MIKIIALLLQAGFVCGGIYLGLMLKADPSTESNDALLEVGAFKTADAEKSHADDKKKEKKADKKKNKKNGQDSNKSKNAFVKFSRQFIVPVVQSNGVNTLVMLDINLEVPPDATESAYAKEPKIRDALLSTLLQLSTEGAFNANFTDQDNIDAIRTRLLTSAQTVMHEEVYEVLILSIARKNI